MTAPRAGQQFTHKSFLDLDSPRRQKALMRITSVRGGRVYYTYASDPTDKGAWYLPTDEWIERYGQ